MYYSGSIAEDYQSAVVAERCVAASVKKKRAQAKP
tara:strand:- start:5182 stop:5286 length:105 start_codon:yes stop_codon:yes gene_type:complete